MLVYVWIVEKYYEEPQHHLTQHIGYIFTSLTFGILPLTKSYMQELLYATKAYSLIHGSDYVIPDHIKAVAPKILNHRLLLSIDSELEGITIEKVIDDVLDKVEVPKDRDKT